jgi:hypothetical protein
MLLKYCDFIADRVRKGLVNTMNDSLEPVRLKDIGRIQWDLGPQGEFRSTAKTILVEDAYGSKYRITIEEAV